MVACGGVNVVGVQLGNSNASGASSTSAGAGSTSPTSSSRSRGSGVGGRSRDRGTEMLPYRRLEYSLELVGEERRYETFVGRGGRVSG